MAPNPQDPHAGQPVLRAGSPVADARLVAIMIHGRGASAENILQLAREFHAADIAYLAPQAAGSTWYPYSFLSPIEQNEPGISSGLRVIERLIADVTRQGIQPERIVLMGFSQGACLSLEFAARHPRQYAAIAGFSGGVIGPPGTPRDYAGTFDRTPVFLGCSDVDPHIPLERVHETAAVFRGMGASVDERIYPGMGHTVANDELEAVDALLSA
jgi:predicted esterase